MTSNPKTDIAPKEAFRAVLLEEGYDTARVMDSPADITATRADETHYFEIKHTNKDERYFGAATLTECEAAIKNPYSFWFVLAKKGFWLGVHSVHSR